ncbi:hypothetical protein, partial [Lacticaseibacillus paracasei]|uniref:hypothetical protein n=1 Tax=Lacticaseibacillus paracasei TaxID=1597 RepID=UPI00194E93C6
LSEGAGFLHGFYDAAPEERVWRRLVADLTWIWGWGPFDAERLTMRKLIWWAEQTTRVAPKRG